ncbi:MAG: cation transporter [Anaerolineaceae bacterium]|nr:cation transporter [Oscillospiraceae bacterium]MBQ6479811.1 cation transporter [Anaerolineaceae bacterium]
MEQNSFKAVATRVSTVSIIINLLLAGFKFIAGVVGHSGAMISDAVHSSSDVIGSLIVIIGVRMSEKASDADHPYGHERMEDVASLILAGILFVAGLSIGKEALLSILDGSYQTSVSPGILALVAAIVSIVVKEGMFWYTWLNAKKISSGALKAEAWHHRSDALSSVGALIGIGGALLGVRIMEPIASIIICLFILKVAIDIFREATDRMVDHACDSETEENIRRCAEEQEGVIKVDMLRTREFGRKIYVDLEISADGSITLRQGHDIAQQVHDKIESTFPNVKHIMVHVNPAD